MPNKSLTWIISSVCASLLIFLLFLFFLYSRSKTRRILLIRARELKEKSDRQELLQKKSKSVELRLQNIRNNIEQLFRERREDIITAKRKRLNYLQSTRKKIFQKTKDLSLKNQLLYQDLSTGVTEFSPEYLIAIDNLSNILQTPWTGPAYPLNFCSQDKPEKGLEDLVCKRLMKIGYYSNVNDRYSSREKSNISINYFNPMRNFFHFERQKVIFEKRRKIPDMLIFVNNKPLIIIELKAPSMSEITFKKKAMQQVVEYHEICPNFLENIAIAIISNGSYWHYSFKPFEKWYPLHNLDWTLKGIFSKQTLLIFLKLAEAVKFFS